MRPAAFVWVMLGFLGGCTPRLVRWEAKGQHVRVLEAAGQARRPPRGAGARAWARAMVHTGHPQGARAILLRDFRHGGDLRSLVALADLELAQGLDGAAAAHYSRAHSLDDRALAGRVEVCQLWVRRAQGLVEVGEAGAAFDDLERVQRACGAVPPGLRAEAAATVRRALDERVELGMPPAESLRSGQPGVAQAGERGQSGAAGSREAPTAVAPREPQALRVWARSTGAQLAPSQVVELLLADGRGALGPSWVDDDELRGWVGDTPPGALAAQVRGLAGPEAAYVSFRLAAAAPGAPADRGPGAAQLAQWVDQATWMATPAPWRLFAYAEDLSQVEMELTLRWRPRPPSDAAATAPAPDAGGHWIARLPPGSGSLDAAILLARLGRVHGDGDRALRWVRLAAAPQHGRGAEATVDSIVAEAARELGWGRPWSALALLDALPPQADLDKVHRAAATAILLGEILWGPGGADPEADRQVVERVLGAPWVQETRARLGDWALAHKRQLPPTGGCPTLAVALAPDGVGPLSQGVTLALTEPDGPELVGTLIRAIESDATLSCAHAILLPLLAGRSAGVGAGRLADMLAYDPQMTSSRALGLQAKAALLAGQGPRAELLAVAAGAASLHPGAVWADYALFAAGLAPQTAQTRDAKLQGYRGLLLHSPGLAHAPARRELVLERLHDLLRSWGAGQTPAGRVSVARSLADYLADFAPAQRWSIREMLAGEVARRGWARGVAGRALVELLLPGSVAQAHPHARARLLGQAPDLDRLGWSPRRLAAAIEAGRVTAWPPATQVFGSPERFAEARLALARRGPMGPLRRSAALGLATFGSDRDRAEAVAELLRMAPTPRARQQVVALLVAGPSALAPGPPPAGVGLVDDPLLLTHVVFGLGLDPLFRLDPLHPAELPDGSGRPPGEG